MAKVMSTACFLILCMEAIYSVHYLLSFDNTNKTAMID